MAESPGLEPRAVMSGDALAGRVTGLLSCSPSVAAVLGVEPSQTRSKRIPAPSGHRDEMVRTGGVEPPNRWF